MKTISLSNSQLALLMVLLDQANHDDGLFDKNAMPIILEMHDVNNPQQAKALCEATYTQIKDRLSNKY